MNKEAFAKALIDARQAGIEAIIGMVDSYPCGGAYHETSGNSEIVKMFKKYGEDVGDKRYEFMGWYAWKSHKGYMVSHGGATYQNMNMHSARTTAESGILGMNELSTSVHTYID